MNFWALLVVWVTFIYYHSWCLCRILSAQWTLTWVLYLKSEEEKEFHGWLSKNVMRGWNLKIFTANTHRRGWFCPFFGSWMLHIIIIVCRCGINISIKIFLQHCCLSIMIYKSDLISPYSNFSYSQKIYELS